MRSVPPLEISISATAPQPPPLPGAYSRARPVGREAFQGMEYSGEHVEWLGKGRGQGQRQGQGQLQHQQGQKMQMLKDWTPVTPDSYPRPQSTTPPSGSVDQQQLLAFVGLDHGVHLQQQQQQQQQLQQHLHFDLPDMSPGYSTSTHSPAYSVVTQSPAYANCTSQPSAYSCPPVAAPARLADVFGQWVDMRSMADMGNFDSICNMGNMGNMSNIGDMGNMMAWGAPADLAWGSTSMGMGMDMGSNMNPGMNPHINNINTPIDMMGMNVNVAGMLSIQRPSTAPAQPPGDATFTPTSTSPQPSSPPNIFYAAPPDVGPGAPAHPLQHSPTRSRTASPGAPYPKEYCAGCNTRFHRYAELRRHLRSRLFVCPVDDCTGNTEVHVDGHTRFRFEVVLPGDEGDGPTRRYVSDRSDSVQRHLRVVHGLRIGETPDRNRIYSVDNPNPACPVSQGRRWRCARPRAPQAALQSANQGQGATQATRGVVAQDTNLEAAIQGRGGASRRASEDEIATIGSRKNGDNFVY